MAVAVPLLLLSGGQQASLPQIPADCYVTSTYTYDSDTFSRIPDLDTAQEDLASQAEELTTRLAVAGSGEARKLRARIDAVRALSQPSAYRSTHASTANLSAYDVHGHLIAKATYGPPSQIFLDPTPADGYLQQNLTFSLRPLPGQDSCK
jgi:hypothetical protein